MAAPSATDPSNLLPILEEESYNVLLELYNNPDKLYEYFAELPTTKELLQENRQLQKSNVEQAHCNISMKNEIEQIISDLQQSQSKLEEANKELRTMELLVDEEKQKSSFESIINALASDLSKEEHELSLYKKECSKSERVDYAEWAQQLLSHHQTLHKLQFAKEWIETNKGQE